MVFENVRFVPVLNFLPAGRCGLKHRLTPQHPTKCIGRWSTQVARPQELEICVVDLTEIRAFIRRPHDTKDAIGFRVFSLRMGTVSRAVGSSLSTWYKRF